MTSMLNGATSIEYKTSVDSGTIVNHAPHFWPDSPFCPDWYQYSVEFYVEGGQYRWALRNHPGSEAVTPQSTDPKGVPMSGTMNWTSMYAAETDTGYYINDPDPSWSRHPGYADANGGGAGVWDMDWSWGSEVVPLEYPGFSVTVTGIDGGQYQVTMTPAVPIPAAVWLLGSGLIGLVGIRRKFRS
ncbi:MAG: VPLPA-CTERM sorting domain-containing protein [Thermodesulfobacteriota bacterium]|nr:VPLPA-CTERM sorting domain-containing protein [Thermodesulfobacteriota bacterium]